VSQYIQLSNLPFSKSAKMEDSSNNSSSLPTFPKVHITKDDAISIAIFTGVIIWLLLIMCAGLAGHDSKTKRPRAAKATPKSPAPLSAQLEARDGSEGCSATNFDDSDPPAYAQDEGRKGKEKEKSLDLPPPVVIQNTGGSNSGRAHFSESSTLLPMYMDGSDRSR
jgi:hypothetical protein